MKLSRVLILILFSIILLASFGCSKTQKPLEIVSGESESDSQEVQNATSLAVALGVKRLYIGAIASEKPWEVSARAAVEFILSSLSGEEIEELATKRALLLRDSRLIEVFETFVDLSAPFSQSSKWIISISASWGCLKACYDEVPACSPCPECCDDPPKGDNYKFIAE